MSDERDGAMERAARLFERALQRPPAERAVFLDGACGSDLALRKLLQQLMDAHARQGSFLSAPPPPGAPDAEPAKPVESPSAWVSSPVQEEPGARIGPYKLLQQVGEGGFGVVFMAEQEAPVRRRVALKIIKLGMDTRQVVARFEQERQALALMDHPNIARVLDAGSTASGRPYFVMELVRGVPITQYCDDEHLSPRERLELFIPVCMAVQHAHSKGVIHRDIKPSNILVTLHDGKPVPKIIDFGIAKATDRRLTEKTLFTELKGMLGTPLYMSPEQAELSGLDVDTRSDVYSLGVLLYELLTGTTPFTAEQLRSAGYNEMQRVIKEVDPPRPSTRVSTMGQALTGIASKRKVEPRRLGLLLRGDLDWVVMKALEKDRARRYDSAAGLADDVRRHIVGDPVVAAPPGMAYRLRKLGRRYRGAVASAAVLLGALLCSLVVFIWSWYTASRNRDIADRQLAGVSAELAARRIAVEEAREELGRVQDDLALTTQRLDELRGQIAEGDASLQSQLSKLSDAQHSLDSANQRAKGTRASLEDCPNCIDGRVSRRCAACNGAKTCSSCNGTGIVDAGPREKCRTCAGVGKCASCNGAGVVATTCENCKGTGRVMGVVEVRR